MKSTSSSLNGSQDEQSAMPLTIVKLGGSLLRRDDWAPRLAAWLQRESPHARQVLIVGGGAAADAVRAADRRESWGDECSHWLAIDAMRNNLLAVAAEFPQAVVCTCLRQVRAALPSAPWIALDPGPLLRRETTWRGLPPLPQSWDVTSDSIAARVAHRLSAAELVLLKSALPPRGSTLPAMARLGYVDAYFPYSAAGLAGRMVDLARDEFPSIDWTGLHATDAAPGPHLGAC